MNQDMNTIYGQDICNYGAGKPRNSGEGFGGRKTVAALRKDFSRFLRFAAVLLLMVVGVSGVKAQNITNGVYYIKSHDMANGPSSSDNSKMTDAVAAECQWDLSQPSQYWYIWPSVTTSDPTGQNRLDDGNGTEYYRYLTTLHRTDALAYHIDDSHPSWPAMDNTYCHWVVKYIGSDTGNKEYYQIINAKLNKYLIWTANSGTKHVRLEGEPSSERLNNSYFYLEKKTDSYYIHTRGGTSVFNVKADNKPHLSVAGSRHEPVYNATAVNGLIQGTTNSSYYVKYDFNSDLLAAPNISIVGDETNTFTITDANTLPACTIRYTTGDGSQAAPTATTGEVYDASNPPTIDGFTNVKAAIFGYGMQLSLLSNAMLNQTITLSQSTYEYSGSAIEPTVTVKYGDNTISSDEYEVTYTDNTNAGTATVSITNKPGGNFYVLTATEQFTINPASVTLTGNSRDTDVYDGTEKTVTGFTSSVEGLTFTGVSASGSGTNAGTYDVTFSGVTLNVTKDATGNYVVTETTNGTLTINPASVTLTANSGTETYDGTVKTITGFTCKVGDQTVESLTFAESVTASGSGTNAGTYDVLFSGVTVNTTKDTSGNYLVTGTTNGTLTINPVSVTLTGNSRDTDVYDGTEKTVTGFTSSVDGLTFTGVSASGSGTDAGTYDVTFSGVTLNTTKDDTGNYVVTETMDGALTINPASVTLTANSRDTDVYDGTEKTVTGFTSSVDGLTFTGVSASGSGTDAGTYDVTFSGVTLNTTKDGTGNYVVTETTNGTLTVDQKEVGLDWSSASLTYNGNAQAPTATATGVVNGDDVSVTVTGTQTDVGTGYTATASELTGTKAGNYKLPADNTTTFEISAKAVTITAKNASKTYNSLALTEGGFTVSALEDGDEYTFTVVMTEGSTITNVGTQPNVIATVDGVSVTAGTETAVGNYKVTTADGTLTVNAKAVTITANDATKEYNGEPLTEGGFTTTALEEGDTHTFTVVMAAESTVTNVGTPQPNVIATVDGVSVTTGTETAVGNYLVTTVNGTLTVTKKLLTITAESGEKEYDGTALTKDTYTYEGTLYSGDAIESVTVTGSQIVAGSSDNVPSAAVIKKEGTDVTENYQITYVNGTLTVTKKALTITADGDTKEYDGTPLTKNTYTNSALATGDAIESVTVTGSQTDAGTSDNVPSDAVIKNSASEIVTACYEITYTNGTLTVTPAAATVTAEAKTKVYGDEEPTYTATVTGLKNNEAASVLTYTFSRETGEDVGEYTITPAGEATQGNYTVTYATAKLTITKAAATVKADDKTKGYGDADQLTATVTGLKNGDDESVITFTLTREEGEDVNAVGYTITPSGAAEQGNYTVTYETGTLTITAKDIGDGTTPAEGIDIDITYDGTNYTVTVKQGENTLADSNYTYSGADDPDHPENYVVTVEGQGNYTNSAKATYTKVTFYDTTPDETSTSETWAAVYCASQNLKVNESFEAHYVTNLENNVLTLTKVEAGESKKNYIPANQPMILISDATPAPMGFTLKPYTDTEVVTIPEGSNLLKVVTAEGGLAVALTQVYIFSLGEFVLTKEGTMSKGKFYLDNPNYSTPAPSRGSLRIVSDDTTGINTSLYLDTDSHHSDIWYTIGGQKLSKKPTRKGLYLQNGRKIVIK